MEAVEENSSFLGNAERVFHYFPTPPCPVLWLPSVFIRYLLSAWDTVPSSWLPARIWKTTRQCITCLLLCENGSLNLPWEPVHLASRPNIHPVCIWSWEPGLWPSRKLGQCYLYVANFVSAAKQTVIPGLPVNTPHTEARKPWRRSPSLPAQRVAVGVRRVRTPCILWRIRIWLHLILFVSVVFFSR